MKTILRSVFDEWEKVYSKEELQEELKCYQNILSSEMYHYFEKLLHCEISVFYDDNFINNYLRKEISGLDIYRKLAIYNIYHQAIDAFHDSKYRDYVDIGGNSKGIEGLQVEGRKRDQVFPLFLYDYSMASNVYDRIKVPNGCKVIKIGDVDLYLDNVIASDGMRDVIIHNLNNKIRNLSLEECVDSRHCLKSYYIWDYQHKDEMYYYNDLLKKIKNKDNDASINEMQEYFSSLFLKNYGLDHDECFDTDVLDGNVRTLTRKYPGGSVRKHIRYI